MTKKQMIRAGIIGIAGAAVLGVGAFFLTHVSIDGQYYTKNAAEYDLTGHELTPEQYSEICARFPDAKILWTVPFQGSRYPMDTAAITVSSLTEAEADSLALFPVLRSVDGTACADPAALVYLQGKRPDLDVRWQLTVDGTACDKETAAVTVKDADTARLTEIIPMLPGLKTLNLEGTLPGAEELRNLQAAFPDVDIRFTVNKWGMALDQDTAAIDLHRAEVTAAELQEVLPLFTRLEEVNLQETALTDTELKTLAEQLPDTFFLCTMDFAGMPFSTDETLIDISEHPITAEETERNLAFFPKLEKLIMSYCGIDSETMEAMNLRHPDTQLVWTVSIGRDEVRTDTKFFYPAGVSESNMPKDEHLVNLKYCHDIVAMDLGHSTASNCDWAQYLPHLRYLIIADTEITDLGPLSCLKELIYLEAFRINVTDYSPLLGCTALQDLNISITEGDPEPLSHMTWLHNLKWNRGANNPETRDRVLMLPEQLPDTNVLLIDDGLSIGEPWRYLPHYYVFRDIIGGVYFNQYNPGSHWGTTDAVHILATGRHSPKFAGDVLAEIVRYRIDNGLPIPGIKNIGSEKAEVLYQSLVNANPEA